MSQDILLQLFHTNNSQAFKCVQKLFRLAHGRPLNPAELNAQKTSGTLPDLVDDWYRSSIRYEINQHLRNPKRPIKTILGKIIKEKYQEVIPLQNQAAVLQRRDADIQQWLEADYQTNLIKQALSHKRSYRFDPQGHIITEVDFSDQYYRHLAKYHIPFYDNLDSDTKKEKVRELREARGLNIDNLDNKEPKTTFCNLDIINHVEFKTEFKQWLNTTELNQDIDSHNLPQAIDALLNSPSRSSIIPLQEEMEFHMRLSARVIKLHLIEQAAFIDDTEFNDLWRNILDTAAQEINNEVRKVFQQALINSFENNQINIQKLNKQLDKSRTELATKSKQALVNACQTEMQKEGFNFKNIYDQKVKPHIKKSDFSRHTATGQDYFRTDESNQTALRIQHTDLTAHHKYGSSYAKRPLHRTRYENGKVSPLLHTNVDSRIPSIVAIDVDHSTSVRDVATSLSSNYKEKQLQRAQDEGPMIYNLLTSLHTKFWDLTIDRRNRQRKTAARILKGAHLFNHDQVMQGNLKSLCYVQNIAVNQHTNNLGHDSFDNATAEATLMAEMAMLSTFSSHATDMPPILSTKIQYEYQMAHELYLKFLRSYGDDRGQFEDKYFKDSPYGQEVINRLTRLKSYLKSNHLSLNAKPTSTLPELATKALLKMMANNQHWDKQYGMLIQSLSVFIQESSIVGCKSANERYQAVSGRVQLLHAINEQSHRQQALTPSANSVITALTNFVDAPKAGSHLLLSLQNSLDGAYNELKLYGETYAVSGEDQGGPPKVQADLESNEPGVVQKWNTNYAETPKLTFLQQKNASKMQAHKGDHAKELNELVAALDGQNLDNIPNII